MKICILTSSFPQFKGDGTGNFILKLVEALSKKHNINFIDVVAPYYPYKKLNYKLPKKTLLHRFSYFFPRKLQKLNGDGGIPQGIKKSLFAKIQLPFFLLNFFIKSLKASKSSDVIHAQWILSAFIGTFVSKIRKIPLIVTIRGDDLNLILKNNFTKPILKYTLKNCNYITANNKQQAAIIKNMGFSNVQAVSNGIDTNLFKPKNKNIIRKKLNIPLKSNIILFVGWLIKRKGINYLIDAFAKLKLKNKLLLLIGDGAEKKKLEDQAGNLDVRFLGNIEHEKLPDYINAADVFVLPSLREGRPNVVAESMACDKTVIATDVGGTKEILNNKTGLLIKPKSAENIKNALENVFSKKLKFNGRKFILDNKLSWEACADRYIEIYKNVRNKRI